MSKVEVKNTILAISVLLMFLNLQTARATTFANPLESVRDTLPVPKGIKNMMFYLQRDPNTNTVVYEQNQLEKGGLDEKDPIHVYWIRYADGGEKKDLSYLQRKFAYGLTSKKLGKDSYELKFVCYSKLPLYLKKATDGKYHVYVSINGKQAILNRIFVRIDGGTFWVPNVLYVELKGTDPVTGKAVSERFKP